MLLGPCCFGKVGREREEGHGTGVRRRLVDRWEVPPRSAAPPPSPHGSGVAPPAVPWSGVAVLEARTTPVVDREEVLWIPRIAAAAVGAVAGAVGGKGWPASAAPLPAWPADVSWGIAPRHAARCHLARARVRGRTVLLFVREVVVEAPGLLLVWGVPCGRGPAVHPGWPTPRWVGHGSGVPCREAQRSVWWRLDCCTRVCCPPDVWVLFWIVESLRSNRIRRPPSFYRWCWGRWGRAPGPVVAPWVWPVVRTWRRRVCPRRTVEAGARLEAVRQL